MGRQQHEQKSSRKQKRRTVAGEEGRDVVEGRCSGPTAHLTELGFCFE